MLDRRRERSQELCEVSNSVVSPYSKSGVYSERRLARCPCCRQEWRFSDIPRPFNRGLSRFFDYFQRKITLEEFMYSNEDSSEQPHEPNITIKPHEPDIVIKDLSDYFKQATFRNMVSPSKFVFLTSLDIRSLSALSTNWFISLPLS